MLWLESNYCKGSSFILAFLLGYFPFCCQTLNLVIKGFFFLKWPRGGKSGRERENFREIGRFQRCSILFVVFFFFGMKLGYQETRSIKKGETKKCREYKAVKIGLYTWEIQEYWLPPVRLVIEVNSIHYFAKHFLRK